MKRKKRNNIRPIRGTYYYRLCWGQGGKNHKERAISLRTKDKRIANKFGKVVDGHADDFRNGVISEYELISKCYWLHGGEERDDEMTLEIAVSKYLEFKKNKVRASSLNRERISLNQLMECLGYSFNVSELDDSHIDDKDGFIDYYQSKGYENTGINLSLRNIKTFTKWLHRKAKLIDEPIEFNFLKEYYVECFVDEHQVKEIYNYIDDETNGIDSYFKRALMFYERTGCRAIEPYISELYGDWLYVQANKSKGGRIRKIKLNDDLKSIWMEMQERKQSYIDNGSNRPNQASYERVAKVLKKIVNTIGITSREITLKSFRHQYAIRRVFITGNVVQVAMEMGHSQITTTQRYLRFQLDELIQYFPSLQQYVENTIKDGKNMQDGNKKMETQYQTNLKLHSNTR